MILRLRSTFTTYFSITSQLLRFATKQRVRKGTNIKKSCCCNSKNETCNSTAGDIVKNHYTSIAISKGDLEMAHQIALKCGYSAEDLTKIPSEACLGLGCGNSVIAAELKEGEKVLDLGCGAGMDLFLSGTKVGLKGKAVGVDFSEEMVKRGNEIAKKYHRENVSFVHSPIDKMPFENETFDVAISNCVLNLVPDKIKAFAEVYRVLKNGSGRFVVSDIVIKKTLPEDLRKDAAAIVGCVGRAVDADTYKKNLELAGFKNVTMTNMNKDLNTLYTKPGFKKEGPSCCCGTGNGPKVDTKVLQKYDLNEYAMSCIVKAAKI